MNPTQKHPDTPGVLAVLTPAVILRCAARYLELHGWTQGDPYEWGENALFPPACTLGAITVAIYGHPVNIENRHYGDAAAADLWDKTVARLATFLWQDDHVREGDYYGALCCSDREIVADWNDDTTQTLTDVLNILRAAADEWDWDHATEDDLETYADACVWAEKHPTREGFLAWLGAR